jgi:hypothetical protein
MNRIDIIDTDDMTINCLPGAWICAVSAELTFAGRAGSLAPCEKFLRIFS